MKKLLLSSILMLGILAGSFAQGDPGISSVGFSTPTVPVGGTAVLTIDLTNGDFVNGLTIPAGGYQVSISLPATLVYVAQPLSTAAITQASGPAFNNFDFDGVNVITADLAAPQAPGEIARLQITVKGQILTPNQVFSGISIGALVAGVSGTDLNNNNNLQAGLQVIGVLPLKLQSFTGQSKLCTNTLNWKSSEEKNVKSIDIETSEDGTIFRTVGTVAAKNVVGTNNYSYTHEGSTAKAYYRLKISDIDGNAVYSDVVSLNTQCKEPSASMYPNPMNALSDGNVVLKNFTGKITGQLQDMNGKQLATIKLLNGSNTINLGKYAQGTYLLKVTDEHQATKTIKIVTYK